MSKAETERFFNDMANDAGLVEAARAVVQKPADLAAFANEHGYTLDKLDIEQAMRAMSADSGALSDEQLKSVAGGGGRNNFFDDLLDLLRNLPEHKATIRI